MTGKTLDPKTDSLDAGDNVSHSHVLTVLGRGVYSRELYETVVRYVEQQSAESASSTTADPEDLKLVRDALLGGTTGRLHGEEESECLDALVALDRIKAACGISEQLSPGSTPSPALPVGQGEDRPPGGREIRVFLSTDGESLAFPGGSFTTVCACRHCGVLIAGGPTACVHCAEAEEALTKPSPVDALRAELMEALRYIARADDADTAPRHIAWQLLASRLERKGGK